jgi:hypothetical protein
MSNPSSAVTELERRIERYFSAQDGMLMVWPDASSVVVYLRPTFLPGIISCGREGLMVNLPEPSADVTIQDGHAEISTGVAVELTRARLTSELCKLLAPMVGRKLLSLTQERWSQRVVEARAH